MWQTIEHGFLNWDQMTHEEKRQHSQLMQQLAEKDLSEFSEEDRRSMEGKQDRLLEMVRQDIRKLDKEVDDYLASKTEKAA
ncbi:MAG: hypothetical protein MUD08_01015 [Cytophagales bacterium]|nr:hypothetical protein [Cytophagales bacterium]